MDGNRPALSPRGHILITFKYLERDPSLFTISSLCAKGRQVISYRLETMSQRETDHTSTDDNNVLIACIMLVNHIGLMFGDALARKSWGPE